MKDNIGMDMIGVRIKLLREQKGLSKSDLSLFSGVSISHISRLEAGKREPSIKVVRKLAVALGVEICVLIE